MSDENAQALNLECFNPDCVRLTRNKNGFIILTLNGENKGRVKLTRAFPNDMPYSYIGITDIEDKEIGIIRQLSQLDSDSLCVAKQELNKRYFLPEISQITSIKEKMGSFYFETIIANKKKNFAVKDISRSIRITPDNSVYISDVDGNRYVIPDFDKIQRKTKRLLEPYLY